MLFSAVLSGIALFRTRVASQLPNGGVKVRHMSKKKRRCSSKGHLNLVFMYQKIAQVEFSNVGSLV